MNDNSLCISIVIATYNGETFIGEQIESIINCIGFDILIKEIIITDDGSSDNTLAIVKEYRNKYSNIVIIENDTRSQGVIENFSRGIMLSDTPYIMLCDQDDVWLKDKISLSFEKIKSVELVYGRDVPVLISTNLKIVDDSLNIISDSFFDYYGINHNKLNNIHSLMLNNISPGCTCIMNNVLVKAALPVPAGALMHDWWLVLVAKSVGVVDILPEATLLYRQHKNNVVGVNKMTIIMKVIKVKKIFKNYTELLEKKKNQAEMLLLLKPVISSKVKGAVHHFRYGRIFPIVWEYTMLRKLLAMLSVLFVKNDNNKKIKY